MPSLPRVSLLPEAGRLGSGASPPARVGCEGPQGGFSIVLVAWSEVERGRRTSGEISGGSWVRLVEGRGSNRVRSQRQGMRNTPSLNNNGDTGHRPRTRPGPGVSRRKRNWPIHQRSPTQSYKRFAIQPPYRLKCSAFPSGHWLVSKGGSRTFSRETKKVMSGRTILHRVVAMLAASTLLAVAACSTRAPNSRQTEIKVMTS